MRKLLLATAFGVGITSAALVPAFPARAQGLNLKVNNNDPLTNLPPDQWITLVTYIVNAAPIIGKDAVYVVNATGEQLLSVTCRSYYLVGPKPYITDNATTAAPLLLPPWTVTLMPTQGFNTYCGKGIDAQGANGGTYHATVNAPSFRDATFVIFKAGA